MASAAVVVVLALVVVVDLAAQRAGASPGPTMVPFTVGPAITAATGAKCLDGSAPTYLLRRNSSSTKYVLFLEGGGWCFGPTPNDTIASCAHRAGFLPLWESLPDKARDEEEAKEEAVVVDRRSGGYIDYGGVLGSDPETNPDFFSWNAVFIHYCDGASFGGGRTEPVAVKHKDGTPAQMWLRGRNNFNAVVRELQQLHGLGAATEVILSGGSAGGLAVFYNLDHLASLLGAGVRLTGYPDAGFFLDAKDTTGSYSYRANFQGADPVWNVTGGGGTNARCLAAHAGAAGDAWQCLMAPHLMAFVETPVYVSNSAYDAYQLPNIGHVSCIPTPSKPCNDTLTQAYRDEFLAAVATVTAGRPHNGAYVCSCYVHEINVNYCSTQGIPNCVGWSPLESGSKKWGYKMAVAPGPGLAPLTPQQAFSDFYLRGTNAVVVDQSRLPHNPSCLYLGHPV